MTRTVKAAVVEGPGKISIKQFPYPELVQGSGAGIMKSIECGICGTDKHTYKGENKEYSGCENEVTVPYPLIQGHEGVGIIEEVAPKSKLLDFYGNELKSGDKVVFCPDLVCGHCYYCRTASWYPWCDDPKGKQCYGNTLSCENYPWLNGAMAEYMYIYPNTFLYKVPEGLPDDLAVMTEVMACTYSLDKAKELFAFDGEGLEFGGTIVIQGCGPLGLCHVIKARMLGAGTIIVTDISDYKLGIAKAFGADICLNVGNTTKKERLDIVRQASNGKGASVVCECAGIPSVVPEGLDMLRKCGIYLELGHFVDIGDVSVNIHQICAKNIRIIGMYNHAVTGYVPTLEMMLRYQKDFPWSKYISHRFKLDDYQKAMDVSMTEESMKVVVECN